MILKIYFDEFILSFQNNFFGKLFLKYFNYTLNFLKLKEIVLIYIFLLNNNLKFRTIWARSQPTSQKENGGKTKVKKKLLQIAEEDQARYFIAGLMGLSPHVAARLHPPLSTLWLWFLKIKNKKSFFIKKSYYIFK